MCSLQEHIEREIRAREAAGLVVTLPPQVGMTTKPREHAQDCTCRPSDAHGFIIGASCVKKFGREALASLNWDKQETADSPQSTTHGSDQMGETHGT